jgi:hypothetical protein
MCQRWFQTLWPLTLLSHQFETGHHAQLDAPLCLGDVDATHHLHWLLFHNHSTVPICLLEEGLGNLIIAASQGKVICLSHHHNGFAIELANAQAWCVWRVSEVALVNNHVDEVFKWAR